MWFDATTKLLSTSSLKGTTDAEGKVSFPIVRLLEIKPKNPPDDADSDKPPRRRLLPNGVEDIYISDWKGGEDCTWPYHSFDEIVKTGVVGDNRCDEKYDTSRFKVSPGEIVIFIRHAHWREGQE